MRIRRVPTATSLNHLGNSSDHRSLVASARVGAVGDQGLAEFRVTVFLQAVDDHLPIPRFEHVQWQNASGQEHHSKRKHRHHGH